MAKRHYNGRVPEMYTGSKLRIVLFVGGSAVSRGTPEEFTEGFGRMVERYARLE